MVPTLAPGGIIIGVWHRRAKVGDVVIIKHQGLEKTKRITQMAGRRIFVEGDNAMQSTDSRQFGWIDQNSVLARVIWPRTGNWPKGRSSGML